MDLTQLVANVANNGIGVVCAAAVLWFAWYRETHTLPGLIASFTESVARSQEAFEDRNQKVVATFTALTREERQQYQQWHKENQELLHELVAELRQLRQALSGYPGHIVTK